MSNERKIEALKGATERKRQEALDKTNQAINVLVKKGNPITFTSVAKEAGVSTAYLYKYDELKKRIQQLQQQQQGQPKSQSPQIASDKSKQVILNQLRERIRQLEVDNRDLRTKNEAVYGRLHQLQAVQQQLEALHLESVTLKSENNCLKQQLDEYRFSVKPQITCTQPAEPRDSKITSLNHKRTEQLAISDKIKQELIGLGIKLNSTLTKAIKSVPEEKTLDAIEAFKEAIVSDNIEKPGAWLKAAIEDGWRKNEPRSCEAIAGATSEFSEWFELAKAQGVAQAKQETEEGLMIQDTTGQWMLWEFFVQRGWTLEYLNKRAKGR